MERTAGFYSTKPSHLLEVGGGCPHLVLGGGGEVLYNRGNESKKL